MVKALQKIVNKITNRNHEFKKTIKNYIEILDNTYEDVYSRNSISKKQYIEILNEARELLLVKKYLPRKKEEKLDKLFEKLAELSHRIN